MTTTLAGPTIDLSPFCADRESILYSAHLQPQTYGGYTWATDGRILICVPAVGPDTVTGRTVTREGKTFTTYEAADGGRFPDCTTQPLPTDAELADASLWQPWPGPDLLLAPNDNCNYCWGRRRVKVAEACRCCGGHKRPCPFCAHLKKDDPMPRAQKVGDHLVALNLDEKVRRLPGVRYRIVPYEGGSPFAVQFAFDGGCGVLMPLIQEPK